MVAMAAGSLTYGQWVAAMIGVYFVFNLIAAVRIATYMREAGRGAARWFVITLLLTAIPYSAYALVHNFGWLFRRADGGEGPGGSGGSGGGASAGRCGRCGRPLGPPDAAADREGLARTCPHCGARVEEERRA
jgi:hypothetical protein